MERRRKRFVDRFYQELVKLSNTIDDGGGELS